VWVRAVDAATNLRESEVVGLGLVDSVQVTTVLPYHLWDIAERLALLSALRVQHKAILRGIDPDDPAIAALLAPQRWAQETAGTDIEQRVRQLEVFAELVGQADAARRRERAVRELATLNDSHAELLAYIGQNTGSDPLTEQMTVDVEAIIAQADEAVRQANEVGRSLVLPERPGLE
jgi:acyl-CoA reductase-like NAD-dependent aldehyde dehydrogenase